MEEESQKTGLVVSGAMHLALLAVLAIGFSRAPKFDDATESIPVETITTTELNQIMQGEKHGRPAPAPPEATPAPTPPTKPEPEKPEPPPPEPPKRPEPPKEAPPKEAPPKPEPPPPEPPKRPEPQKPPPPKPETEAPKPPVRTHVAETRETPPRPPEKPRSAPPKPEETPKPDKFKPDEIAKALKEKPEEKPHPKAAAYDPSAISKLIGQSRTAEASPQAATPQGLPNRNAPRMSVSLENGLNEWFRDSYKNCWNLPPSNPSGENYVFNVRVTFNPDGSLAARPEMLNPPHDPEWRAHADSVMRAVQRCNPLHIPAQYAPYFEQWRTKVVHFDPSNAEG